MAAAASLSCPRSSRVVQPVRRSCHAAASPSVTWPTRPLSGKSSETPAIANNIAPATGLRQRVDRPGLSHDDFASARVESPFVGPANLLSGSHTRPAHAPTAAHGCYRVIGPARISRRGDTLIAHLQPGSRVEFFDRHGSPSCCVTHEQLLPPDAREQYLSSLSSASSMDIAPVAAMELSRSSGHAPNNNSNCGNSLAGKTVASGSSCDYAPLDVWSLTGECVLVGTHVELGGSASSVDMVDLSVQPAVHHHHGRTYLSVRALPPHTVIQLDGDAELRHPVNVTPPDQDGSSGNSNGFSSSCCRNKSGNGNGHLYQRT